MENRIGEDERENTEDPGAESYPSLPGGGEGIESSSDPSTATALSLKRKDIEARHTVEIKFQNTTGSLWERNFAC